MGRKKDDYFSSGESWIKTIIIFVVTVVVIGTCVAFAVGRVLATSS